MLEKANMAKWSSLLKLNGSYRGVHTLFFFQLSYVVKMIKIKVRKEK